MSLPAPSWRYLRTSKRPFSVLGSISRPCTLRASRRASPARRSRRHPFVGRGRSALEPNVAVKFKLPVPVLLGAACRRVATQADRSDAGEATERPEKAVTLSAPAGPGRPDCPHKGTACSPSLPHPGRVQPSSRSAVSVAAINGGGSTDEGGKNSGGRTPRCAPQATTVVSTVGMMIVSNPATRAAAAAPRDIRTAGSADRAWDETSTTVAARWGCSEAAP